MKRASGGGEVENLHKMSTKGSCKGCNINRTPATLSRHLPVCTKLTTWLMQFPCSPTGFIIKISAAYSKATWWMFVSVPMNATLKMLDDFIRDEWVECCGHLSSFTIGGQSYLSYDNPIDEDSETMGHTIASLNLTEGTKMEYIYDMGTSTELSLVVVKEYAHCPINSIAKLAQNDPPVVHCPCNNIATGICTCCDVVYCDTTCDHPEKCDMGLPLVNSPRCGLCGYE